MSARIPRVRVMKPEEPSYSTDHPNPNWRTKGKEWIDFALNRWKLPIVHDVAYIPHVLVQVRQGGRTHAVILTKWDLKQNPKASNFSIGGGDNKFRLNARYPKRFLTKVFLGSRKNVDLSPTEDVEAILELLKLAEIIHDPPK